MNYAPKRFDDN